MTTNSRIILAPGQLWYSKHNPGKNIYISEVQVTTDRYNKKTTNIQANRARKLTTMHPNDVRSHIRKYDLQLNQINIGDLVTIVDPGHSRYGEIHTLTKIVTWDVTNPFGVDLPWDNKYSTGAKYTHRFRPEQIQHAFSI